jgi:membrane protein implicated in regulation of membrane protease activity
VLLVLVLALLVPVLALLVPVLALLVPGPVLLVLPGPVPPPLSWQAQLVSFQVQTGSQPT